MYYTSGKDVTVTIWGKGLTFQGRVEQWNQKEVIIHERNKQTKWTFPYQDILKGKVKITPKRIH
ncbi:hypothetical protein [Ammoniphilus sp. YIM 78166]|uniref:hypothetical protein n=1 Tax=Ammoniphilus sp. YIM 78166 TaxID=1644106 RepID=UPI00106FBCA3|nr:hypothetical protein [Ammoniphilus sp. YIM 78166]